MKGTTRRARTQRERISLGAAIGVALSFGIFSVLAALHRPPECTPLGTGAMTKTYEAPPCMIVDRDHVYLATLETSFGTIRLVLDPRLGDAAVNNFVFLAREGFYDNTTFHRIENTADHALVQGGDPTGTGRGGPGYFVDSPPPAPITRYSRGVVAAANAGSPSKTGSQFFIIVRDYEALGTPNTTPRYALLGKVADQTSMDVLDQMVNVDRDGTRPRERIYLRSVTIEVEPISGDQPSP